MKTQRVYMIPLTLVLLAFPPPGLAGERSQVPDPPAVVPGAVEGTAVEAEVRYGPTVELLLSSESDGTNYVVNLDTGQLLTPAHEMEINQLLKSQRLPFQQAALAWKAYLRGLGSAIINERSLTGLRMYLSKLEALEDGGEWNSLSARQCARKIDRVRADSNPLGDQVIMRKTLPITWIFQTREGSRGILQVVDTWDQPKKVKIRYRLIEKKDVAATPPVQRLVRPSRLNREP